MRLGIDFGTTRTVVAACDRGNTPVVSFEGPEGSMHDHIPSLVASDGENLRYGWEAAAVLGQPGWSGLRAFKRLLSGPEAHPARRVVIGSHDLLLHDVITGFLSHVREQLARSNAPGAADEGPHQALVAVPAGASSQQRFVTLEAFRAAGFQVEGMLNEPSAAGVEYAHRYARSITSKRQDILVYDLGGGTFDASRVVMGQERHEVVGHVGLGDLGGSDFDEVLLSLALQASGTHRPADPTSLLEHCREQKEGLSPNTRKLLVELDDDTVVTLATADLYAACSPLIQRSVTVLEHLLDGDDSCLAGVYVVGGASELPAVARILKERFGRRVKRSAYASASIAVGLALALDGQGPELAETLSRAFGVFREWSGGDAIVFDALLRPDRPLDGEALVRRYRAVHNVGHLRFAECDHLTPNGQPEGCVTPFAQVQFPYDQRLVGSDLSEVPVERVGQGPVIEERYQVDDHGMVHLRITNLDTGFHQEHALG